MNRLIWGHDRITTTDQFLKELENTLAFARHISAPMPDTHTVKVRLSSRLEALQEAARGRG